MVDRTEKAKIPLKFANMQHDITNLAQSTFAIALFSALQYCYFLETQNVMAE